MRALAALSAACILLAAGCGGRPAGSDRAWRANLKGLTAQLRADVAAVEQVGASRGTSAEYARLVAYADLGGCSTMVANTGAPAAAARVLARACPRLERAALLYTRGELRKAARVAGSADGQLVRAQLRAR